MRPGLPAAARALVSWRSQLVCLSASARCLAASLRALSTVPFHFPSDAMERSASCARSAA
eukprot:4717069-Lingulodinium_polyedra.AAC.1